jgi:hypothetical protein
MGSPATLVDVAGIRIDDLDGAGFTVRVACRPWAGVLLLVPVLLMFTMAIVLTGGVAALCVNFPRDGAIPTLVFISLFSAMALVAWWGSFVGTLMWLRFCFDRVLEFDSRRQELRLRNVPMFSRDFPLHRISGVVICSGTLQWGTPVVWLCLAIEGMRRKLLIQSAVPTTHDEKTLANALTSAGELISRRLNVPLHKVPHVGLLEISFI